MSSIAIVTGSGGLVGSAAARRFHAAGMDVIGIDSDQRGHFFGPAASTAGEQDRLGRDLARYRHIDTDIRDAAGLETVFSRFGKDAAVVIHAAAQPSHDWAAGDPVQDFEINAGGTLNILEATRRHAPSAAFIFHLSQHQQGLRRSPKSATPHARRQPPRSRRRPSFCCVRHR